MRTSRGANSLAVWTLVITFLFCGIGNALGTPERRSAADGELVADLALALRLGRERPRLRRQQPVARRPRPRLRTGARRRRHRAPAARDLGEGFIPERLGRAEAGPLLSTPTGLVWRLTWGAILGWTIGGLLTGMLSTSLASVVDQVSGDNPAIVDDPAKIGGSNGSLEQATVSVFFLMLGIFAACAAVQIVSRARQEEAHGTAEPVLSAAVGRVRWLVDYLVVAFSAMVLVVVAGVLGAMLGLASADGDWELMETIVVTAFGQLVAASVFLVLTALVFVLAPRATIAAGWTLIAVGAMFGLFGPLFGFPDWLASLSPLEAAPKVTTDGVDLKAVVAPASWSWSARRHPSPSCGVANWPPADEGRPMTEPTFPGPRRPSVPRRC